ncbi:MAG: M48 family metalloprotease [Candidatus Paceibacterota bacterium]|jgi:heat shock protein HtpX
MPTTYNRIDENMKQTMIFVSVFVIFLAIAAYIVDLMLLRNHFYAALALAILLAASFGDYIFSNKLILKENRAVALDRKDHEDLYNTVENLSKVAGIPVPKICKTPDIAINAFTIGKKPENAVLVLTEGALSRLDNLELEGVVAHEIAHIENNDVMLATSLVFLMGFIRRIVDIVVNMIKWFSEFLSSEDAAESLIKAFIMSMFYGIILIGMSLALVLSFIPFIEELVFYGISRKREFLADAEGVLFTRYPMGLALALEKIAADSHPLETRNYSTAHLYISSPFRKGSGPWWESFFHSHPPIERRIEILKQMDEYGNVGSKVAG